MKCRVGSALILSVAVLSTLPARAIDPGPLIFFLPSLEAYSETESVTTVADEHHAVPAVLPVSESEAWALLFAAMAFLLATRRTAPINLRTVHSRLRAKNGHVPTR